MKFKSETRLLEPRDPKVIEMLEQPGSALNVLMERDGLQLPFTICKGDSKYACCGTLMKNSAPLLSSLNNMGLGDVPPELSCLNDFEKVLIQRAKCFMTIVKLKPYRYRGPQNTLTKAKKGTAVHFDLPTERTVQYVAETLPSTQFVEVMVDTIPTRSNIVWRSVVDMDKVVHALEYLRSHGNELYSNIKIDYSALDVDDEEPIPESSDEGEEILDSPNLQHMTEEEAKNQCDHYTVKALAHEFAKTDEIDQFLENYKFRRVQGDPVKEYDEKGKKLEGQCFPCLFPDGTGYFADQRNIPVPFRQYARSRLQNKDSRFRKDYQYLFYLLHHKEMKMIDQGVFATFRTGNAQDMTVGALQDRLSAKDKLLEANMNNLLTSFRGSEQFWNRKSSDLAAMDREFGPATFFLTLSCKEYEWEELRVYLEAIDTDLAGKPLSYLCAKNPVAVSIYFEHRFRRFFNGVILDKNGPLGEIEHWVWRLEYQSRGAPHTHIKLWAKNAPILGEENVTEEMVIAYIDKHITCRRPDPVTEYDLYKMVTENQTHRCTDSCLVKRKRRPPQCRYGFPRPAQNKTTLNTLEESVKSRVKGRRPKKIYDLARAPYEEHINDYNPAILLMWRANIDIQYVGESSMVLNHYITSYVTKADRSATKDLWETICQEHSERTVTSNLKSMAVKSLKSREVGGNEAADQILGHTIMAMSDTVKWLAAKPKNLRTRKFKKSDELNELPEDSTDLYADNIIDVYYPNRPPLLENHSLHDIVSVFSWEKGEAKEKEDVIFPFQFLKANGEVQKAFFKRGKRCIIKCPVFPKSGDQAEKYFFQMLLLFKPWRNEEFDLKDDDESYREAFEKWFDNLTDAQLIEIKKYRSKKERMEKALEAARTLREDAEAEAANESKENNVDDEEMKGAGERFADLRNQPVDPESVQDMVDSLNSDQRRIFDKIVQLIDHQDKHTNAQCSCDDIPAPLRMFITGVGGTGKSYLIQTLSKYIVNKYTIPKTDDNQNEDDNCYVVVMAPTGVAAFNINGLTIHRCFKMPVQKPSGNAYI